MKRILIIIMLIGLLYGCMEESSVISPDLESGKNSSSFQFINLPESSAKLAKIASLSKTISNAEGGEISLNNEYISSEGKLVKVFASIHFPAGAFYGSADQSYNITMTLDNETTSESFTPHMQFNNFPTYNIRYEGIDLSGVNPEEIEYLFRAEDGSTEKIESDPVVVDPSNGVLEVKNVRIPHFSRYGFGS